MNLAVKFNWFPAYFFTSDNANLLDIAERSKLGRLLCNFLAESAAQV